MSSTTADDLIADLLPGRWRGPAGLRPAPLRQCLLLALLLHVLTVLVLGNAPGGSARPGEGVWGALNVTLRGEPLGRGEAATVASDAYTGPQGTATQRRWGGAVRRDDPDRPADDRPGAARLGQWQAQPTSGEAVPAAAEPAAPAATPEAAAPPQATAEARPTPAATGSTAPPVMAPAPAPQEVVQPEPALSERTALPALVLPPSAVRDPSPPLQTLSTVASPLPGAPSLPMPVMPAPAPEPALPARAALPRPSIAAPSVRAQAPLSPSVLAGAPGPAWAAPPVLALPPGPAVAADRSASGDIAATGPAARAPLPQPLAPRSLAATVPMPALAASAPPTLPSPPVLAVPLPPGPSMPPVLAQAATARASATVSPTPPQTPPLPAAAPEPDPLPRTLPQPPLTPPSAVAPPPQALAAAQALVPAPPALALPPAPDVQAAPAAARVNAAAPSPQTSPQPAAQSPERASAQTTAQTTAQTAAQAAARSPEPSAVPSAVPAALPGAARAAAPGAASSARLGERPLAGAPDAGARLGHDLATPPSLPASAPRLNLELARPRGGELSRRSTAGVLPLLPRPPDTPAKSKLAEELDKAGKPDCRTAYSAMGLAAAAPLVRDAIRGDGCRW